MELVEEAATATATVKSEENMNAPLSRIHPLSAITPSKTWYLHSIRIGQEH
ncbi:hypothetical protein DAPPUDRAFT_264461 [Daphnia pulex]|uniref:Uncharacterized protein n=1 Tax=Daphnia pulex TaxID=6669 RepID=E9HRM5_DAPPU|nr:hypothetical protein DAPPUDRAFT_264461 [Daphnia pulex]|eukprot:EFX65605.1 hypothetical protein DAPPUDRAFT_264461 [Daphnia pulex]